jgi:hypothetical protein
MLVKVNDVFVQDLSVGQVSQLVKHSGALARFSVIFTGKTHLQIIKAASSIPHQRLPHFSSSKAKRGGSGGGGRGQFSGSAKVANDNGNGTAPSGNGKASQNIKKSLSVAWTGFRQALKPMASLKSELDTTPIVTVAAPLQAVGSGGGGQGSESDHAAAAASASSGTARVSADVGARVDVGAAASASSVGGGFRSSFSDTAEPDGTITDLDYEDVDRRARSDGRTTPGGSVWCVRACVRAHCCVSPAPKNVSPSLQLC